MVPNYLHVLTLPTPFPVPTRVRLRNASPCPWPAVGVGPEGLVGLTYRWVSPSGQVYPPGAFSRFLRDIGPGETVDDTMMIFPAGGEYGSWRLEVSLVQHGQREALAQTWTTVELRPFARHR